MEPPDAVSFRRRVWWYQATRVYLHVPNLRLVRPRSFETGVVGPPHMTTQIDYERLYADVLPSVVSLYVDIDGRRTGTGSGSGFVYDGDHIVTNQHVVTDTPEVDVRFSHDDWRLGRVIGTDAYTDLAVVRVEDLPDYATPLPVAEDNPTPGRPVAALGNPLGLDGSITAGIVSGANRSMTTNGRFAVPDVVQTDAAINPGNSGGPLVALAGDGYEVVGVNRAKSGDNIGFAISPVIVNTVIPVLIDEGRYHHSYLRVSTLDVTPTVAEANGLDEPRGVLLVDVHPSVRGSLRPSRRRERIRGREVPVGGDVIVGIDGRELHSHEELTRHLITETHPGEPVELELVRDGRQMTVTVTLGERPQPDDDGRRIRIR